MEHASALTNVLTWWVILAHAAFAVVEMLAWSRPAVHGRFGFTAPEAAKARPIVANAGLYNGFFAGAFLWSYLHPAVWPPAVVSYLLACVVVAGVFGAITLRKPSVLALQSLPVAILLLSS